MKQQNYNIEIIHETMLINNIVVPYGKQVMSNTKSMFITDLGIQIEVNSQLKEYDQKYFDLLLKQQIIQQIEVNHISVGLQILQSLPSLNLSHYEFLFSKLSILKIKKCLTDNNFYRFFWNLFKKINNFSSTHKYTLQQILMHCCQPYQRIFHLQQLSEGISNTIIEIIKKTSLEILYDSFNRLNFIEQIVYLNLSQNNKYENKLKQQSNLNHLFLKKLCNLIQYTQYNFNITQLIQSYNFNNNSIIKEHIFNQKCLYFISTYFQYYYYFDRTNLLTCLTLIITYNPTEFWNSLFNQHSIHQSSSFQRRDQSDKMSNLALFSELLKDSLFRKDNQSWTQSLYIIESLINNKHPAYDFLLDFFQQMIAYNLNTQSIDLMNLFIKFIFKQKKQNISQFKRLLSDYYKYLIQQINKIYKTIINKQNIQQINLILINNLIKYKLNKINKILICAYLRTFIIVLQLNLFYFIKQINLQTPIKILLIITKIKTGLISSTRNHLVNLIKIRIINDTLKYNYISTNIKHEKINILKQYYDKFQKNISKNK